MDLVSATGETWGISGPKFLAGYLSAAVVLIIAAVALRRDAVRRGAEHAVRVPSRGEIAFLMGGPAQALYASLAGLRAAGAVGLADEGALTRTGATPAGMSRLDEAVYDAAGRGVRVTQLISDDRVHLAVEELAGIVDRAGWCVSDSARARARLGANLLLALSALGVVRLIAGIVNGRPVMLLILSIVVVGVVAGSFRRVPRLTPAAKAALTHAQVANRHLAPSESPSWGVYGLTGAAMGVALYGTSALWAADPAFAAEAGINNRATNPWPSGNSDGGGEGSGGGCGGGGSDGGGGCGGGGCSGGGCGG